MAHKKRITPLVESGKNQQLELLDVSPEERKTKSPESLPPIRTSDKIKSRMYQCKRNFGLFLMGILMFSSHLKKFISVTLASCFYHQSLLLLIAISMLFEALISIIALVMIFYNVNNRQSVKANIFNNILQYCILAIIYHPNYGYCHPLRKSESNGVRSGEYSGW
ncbi:uncharacterized protein LOC106674285 isoform X2 [Cimex lectularius]|uniref:Uncharacterized protein n=1 Tax=Cimex lectularius TaxID=79782 RepID=A0A8I6SJK5_CIMLE|nr:uncharacterized protein LOC106674285 isoform X2 [Cimex lectularius]